MGSNGKGGPASSGPPAGGLPPDVAQGIANDVYVALKSFMPLLPDPQIAPVVQGVLGDVVKLGPFLAQVAAGTWDAWGIQLEKKNLVALAGLEDSGSSDTVNFMVPTNPREITTAEDMLKFVSLLAILTSPVARAIIAVTGFKMRVLTGNVVTKQ